MKSDQTFPRRSFCAKKCFLAVFALILALVFASIPGGAQTHHRYRVKVANPRQAKKLFSEKIDIVGETFGESFDIRCTPQQAAALKQAGFKLERIAESADLAGDVPPEFHDYAETRDFLRSIADLNPTITRLDSLGETVEGRGVWALKISDNPEIDEDEPCLLVEGCIHGNEHHGLEACLFFITYLTQNYGVIPEVTRWVDEREIWVIPLVNPDGHEKNQRRNAHDVDLNRNFGYWWSYAASKYGSAPFSEPETQILRDFAREIRPYSSLAFHTSGRKILYPWAYTSETLPPDHQLFQQIANELADSINAVNPAIQYTPIRSGAWYWHGGEHNDWMYSQYGMISFTIELMTSQTALPSDDENHSVLPALRVLLRLPERQGVTGHLVDAATGNPLSGTVTVREIFDPDQLKPRTADSRFGRYFRLLPPGQFTLEYYSPGHRRVIQQVTIDRDSVRVREIGLQRAADLTALSVEIVEDQGTVSQGSGNGLVNRGETVQARIRVQNAGIFAAAGVSGTVACASPFVTLLQDSLYFGEVAAQAETDSRNLLSLLIDAQTPPGTRLPLVLTLKDQQNAQWQQEIELQVQGFFDDMEQHSMGAWRHGSIPGAQNPHDDWQFGPPNGKNGDPSQAYSGNNVWGTDLGGSGWNGAYQSNVDNYLETPPVDCSGWNSVQLQFYRWLNVLSGDRVYVAVNGQVVWENHVLAYSDRSWQLQTLDISQEAADLDSVVIRFGLQSNGSGTTGGWTLDDVMVDAGALSPVAEAKSNIPEQFRVWPAYPNPFNPETTIEFALPNQGTVEITCYNALGQAVRTVAKAILPAGHHQAIWDGRDSSGQAVAAGVYLVRVVWNGRLVQTQKVVLLK